MGGSIAMVIRKRNGDVLSMNGWTNPLPYIINNPKIIRGHHSYINSIVKTWADQNKKTKEPIFYEVAPDGYGLVVIDYEENLILTCQGYTSFGVRNLSAVNYGKRHPEPDSDWELLKAFYQQGRVKGVGLFCKEQIPYEKGINAHIQTKNPSKDVLRTWKYNQDGKTFRATEKLVTLESLGIKSWEDLEKTHDEIYKTQYDTDGDEHTEYTDYIYDMSPFQVVEYSEDKSGFLFMKQKMIDLGFVFTAKDDKAWDEYLKERE